MTSFQMRAPFFHNVHASEHRAIEAIDEAVQLVSNVDANTRENASKAEQAIHRADDARVARVVLKRHPNNVATIRGLELIDLTLHTQMAGIFGDSRSPHRFEKFHFDEVLCRHRFEKFTHCATELEGRVEILIERSRSLLGNSYSPGKTEVTPKTDSQRWT